MTAAIPEQKAIAETISGLIEPVTFHHDENHLLCASGKTQSAPRGVTVLGSLPSLTAGEWVEADGWLETKSRDSNAAPD